MDNSIKLNYAMVQRLAFIDNALEDGWSIKKIDTNYIFYKKHEGKKEVYSETYLNDFIKKKSCLKKIIS